MLRSRSVSTPARRSRTPLAALLIGVAAAGAMAAPATAGARTYIFDGGELRLVYKPHDWAAGGVGASARMEDLHWTTWNARRAVARGTAANNDCDPSCAEGSIVREPGRLTWTRPRTCRTKGGRRLRFFTLVRYRSGGSTTTFRFGSLGRYNCSRTSPYGR